MKKVVLKKCLCSYSKRERDFSGITSSSVANDAADKRLGKNNVSLEV